MRRSVDVYEPSADILALCRRSLDEHGVVAFPTETFYGLAASALDVAACLRIFELKGRPGSKALPCIVSDWSQLDVLAELERLSKTAGVLADSFWPGPLTLVVPARTEVAAASEEGTVAVRVSPLPLATALARECGPITSTSANVSGTPPATTANDVSSQFPDGLSVILDGGECEGGLPSTIVDVTSEQPVLVRAGRVPFESIERLFLS